MNKLTQMVIVTAIVYIYIFLFLMKGIYTVDFHKDEYYYLCSTKYYQLYLRGNIASQSWYEKWNYSEPKLFMYIYSVFLNVFQYHNEVIECDLPYGEVSEQDIYEARFMSVIISFITMIVLFGITYAISNWITAIVTVGVIIHIPVFNQYAVRAMAEPLYILFMFLALIVGMYLYAQNRIKIYTFILLEVLFSSFAILSKLYGFVTVPFVVLLLFLYTRHSFKKRIIYSCIYVSLVSVMFISLTPYIWHSPIRGFQNFVHFRSGSVMSSRNKFPKDYLPDAKSRFIYLMTQPSGLYVLPEQFRFGGNAIFIATLMIGIILLITDKTKNIFIKVYLYWSIILVISYLLFSPFNWDRYLLPVQLTVVPIQFAGIQRLIVRLRSRMKHSDAGIKHSV